MDQVKFVEPLKNLKGYGLLKAEHTPSKFQRLSSAKFTWSFLNTLSHMIEAQFIFSIFLVYFSIRYETCSYKIIQILIFDCCLHLIKCNKITNLSFHQK